MITKNVSVYKVVKSEDVSEDGKNIVDNAKTYTTTTNRRALEIVEILENFGIKSTVFKQTVKVEIK